jgi:hypothetical protein
MKSSGSTRKCIIEVLGNMALACLLSGPLPSLANSAEPRGPTTATPEDGPTHLQETTKLPVAPALKDWQNAMRKVRPRKIGCFKASYPSLEWQEIACTAAPSYPQRPARGFGPNSVGNHVDYSAEVTGARMFWDVIGSFDSVTNSSGTVTENGFADGIAPAFPDIFSLQLNTNLFPTSDCSGATDPATCKGWQQFVYSNYSRVAYLQYWLHPYGPGSCPAGWTSYVPPPPAVPVDCYRSSSRSVPVPSQIAANLGQVSLEGTVNSDGTDTVTMTTGTDMAVRNEASVLNLAPHWQAAEFNVLGDGYGSEATFNAGTTIQVRLTVRNGTTDAPQCVMEGFTGETNNLSLVGTAAIPIQPLPTMLFTESNIPGTLASCAAAKGLGDTHLTTFGGLLYDFQASGDFVLAQTDPDFVVQTTRPSPREWARPASLSAVRRRDSKSMASLPI